MNKFKRHSRSLSQQSLGKIMADVKKEDAIQDKEENLAETTRDLKI